MADLRALSEYEGAVNQITQLQRTWRSHRLIRKQQLWTRLIQLYSHFDEAKTAKRRFKLWNEIITTEKTYQDGLRYVVETYKPKLLKSEAVSAQELNAIFSGVQEICNISGEIYSQLVKKVLPTTSGAPIGEVFRNMLPFLKMYIPYVVNFEKFITSYSNLKQSKKFLEIEKEIQENDGKNLNLGDLLITPVQRIPRYKLFFDQLLILTADSFPGYEDILIANQEITSLCETINDSKKKAESMHHTLRIQRQLVGDYGGLLGLGRRFVKEGAVQLHCISENPNLAAQHIPSATLGLTGEYYVFGFDDIQIIAQKNKNSKPLNYTFVTSIANEHISSVNVIVEKPGACSLQLQYKGCDAGVWVYWISPSAEETQSWVDLMSLENGKTRIPITADFDDQIGVISSVLGPLRISSPSISLNGEEGSSSPKPSLLRGVSGKFRSIGRARSTSLNLKETGESPSQSPKSPRKQRTGSETGEESPIMLSPNALLSPEKKRSGSLKKLVGMFKSDKEKN